MAEQGFDVSAWQAGAYAGGGGFTFGVAKLTEATGFKDTAADRHMAAILAQPIAPGGYHFARPDLDPGTAGAYAEADWFWRIASSYGGARGMLLALDLEVGSGDLRSWRDDFLGRLSWRAAGYQPGWYTYWNFAQTRGLEAPAGDCWGWLAWPDSNGALPNSAFSVAMQQWGLTSVPGVTGSADANRFFGTVQQLRALTVGGSAASTGGTHAMGTVACLYLNGVRHDFRISSADSVADVPGPAGDLLWARTSGGEGGALHDGYWRLGGSGPTGGIVDFTVAVNPANGLLDLVAVFGPPNGGPSGGLELQTSWDPAAATKPALRWDRPDNAGPWRVPVHQGAVLTPDMLVNAPAGPAGPPGPTYDDTELRGQQANHTHPVTGEAGPSGV